MSDKLDDKDKPVLTLVEDMAEAVSDENLPAVNNPEAKLSDEGTRLRAKRDYVFFGRTVKELSVIYEVSQTTVRYWRDKEGWETQKKQADEMREDFQKALVLIKNTDISVKDLKSLAIRKALNVLILSSTKLEHLLARPPEGMDILPLAGEVQKLVASVEKFIAADIKNETGGVEQKNITHTHVHLDVNEAMKLIQEARARGQKITVEEAMNLLQAQKQLANGTKVVN